MKVKDIKLGERYAVTIVTPGHSYATCVSRSGAMGHRSFPRTSPVIHATCVDVAGNTVVFEHEAMVPKPGAAAKANLKNGLIGIANYEPGKKLVRVRATDVLCLSDEYTGPPARDGRIDAPEVTQAAGHTFTADRLAVTG